MTAGKLEVQMENAPTSSDLASVDDLRQTALNYHSSPTPGKVSMHMSKPADTSLDLALAYSPGVAAPCREIFKDPRTAYSYTSKGNLVGVVSNGTAVLGLGNLGALASKPVMEGKGVLFKRFAGVDCYDIEVDVTDVEEFIKVVRAIAPTFGGINLEDIRAPDCFVIEKRLKEICPIPVFHDDQHGTAIVTAAAMLNGLIVVKKKMTDIKLVCLGAGAAAISCLRLLNILGLSEKHVYLCDTKGVVYSGRQGVNEYKAEFQRSSAPAENVVYDDDVCKERVKKIRLLIESTGQKAADSKYQWENEFTPTGEYTGPKTLNEAIENADVFLGVSGPGLLEPQMLKRMAENPLVFACANPDPEIFPEQAYEARKDVIMATGRSDYPNQVNNVLGFPYIFRGALDVRAKCINNAMKVAAVKALMELAQASVPEAVADAYGHEHFHFGPHYLIPKPLDPRLLPVVSAAVAKAAVDSGVAGKPYPKHYPIQSVEDIFPGVHLTS